MALHKDLTGADLHEPKGIDSASADQIYVADGAGSGVWQNLVIPSGTFIVTTTEFTSNGTWNKPTNIFLAKVTVIGGGGGGGSGAGTGGTSSFGAYLSATGGQGGTNSITTRTGGSGSGGVLNFTGDSSFTRPSPQEDYPGAAAIKYGQRGNGGKAGPSTGHSSGAGGGASIEWLTDAELTDTVSVTVGAGGAAGAGSGEAGIAGIVIVEEYVAVT